MPAAVPESRSANWQKQQAAILEADEDEEDRELAAFTSRANSGDEPAFTA